MVNRLSLSYAYTSHQRIIAENLFVALTDDTREADVNVHLASAIYRGQPELYLVCPPTAAVPAQYMGLMSCDNLYTASSFGVAQRCSHPGSQQGYRVTRRNRARDLVLAIADSCCSCMLERPTVSFLH